MRTKTDSASSSQDSGIRNSKDKTRTNPSIENPPFLTDDDEVREAEAEELAREAREAGIALISDHLDTHLQQNPDSSFVTWIATLHPENAKVTIDPRFFVPENPWWTVYEEAHQTLPYNTTENNSGDVNEEEASVSAEYHLVSSSDAPTEAVMIQEQFQQNHHSKRNCCHGFHVCSPVEICFGIFFSLSACFLTVMLELVATFLYLITSFFYSIAWILKQGPMVLTGVFYGVFMSAYYLFSGIDSFILLISILFGEILAAIACVFCCLVSGCQRAQLWHQYIRRTSHLLRWVFRGNTNSPNKCFPPRLTQLMAQPHGNGEEDGGDAGDNHNSSNDGSGDIENGNKNDSDKSNHRQRSRQAANLRLEKERQERLLQQRRLLQQQENCDDPLAPPASAPPDSLQEDYIVSPATAAAVPLKPDINNSVEASIPWWSTEDNDDDDLARARDASLENFSKQCGCNNSSNSGNDDYRPTYMYDEQWGVSSVINDGDNVVSAPSVVVLVDEDSDAKDLS